MTPETHRWATTTGGKIGNPQLPLAPLLRVVAFALALRRFTRQLNPVAGNMRAHFGTMNAGIGSP